MFKQNDRGRTAPGRFYLAGPNMAKGIKQNGLWPGHPRRTIPFARLKGWWRRGAGLALVMGLLQATGQGNVVINEIHYDPDIKTEPVEFVELYNAGAELVDLSGWRFSAGVTFAFPPNTVLPAGGYLVVAQNPTALQAKFGVHALGPWEGRLANEGETITLRNGANEVVDQVTYRRGFPWPTVGDPPGYSIELVNPAFDNDLGGNWRASVRTAPPAHGPTPGARNSVFATNLPPAIRQVKHQPSQPVSGQPVVISAKVTDPQGVVSVSLLYQFVEPGNYIELTDAAYTNTWTSLPLNDAGVNGDEQAGDHVYSVVLPGTWQTHRRLVRYRIQAKDGTGATVTVPYADDPQPNFAYFCYDGVPAWRGAVQPGVTPMLDFDTSVMRRLPVVHLLSKSNSVVRATWFDRYRGDEYRWLGTLVYDGKVYDHIRYRARGGVHRYKMVKNMWKFAFNRGHDFQMRDDYGRPYSTPWRKLNLGACIQQGDYGHRGEQGMFESVGFRLFNLAGVPSPKTTFLQFRIISTDFEARPHTQYEGDFWGLYLAVEQMDGRFLDEHQLPDGNLYKMEEGTGELNNLGPLGPTDKSDLNSFLGAYRSTSAPPDEAWWRNHLLLPNYWSYQAIVQGIHHYDICYGKNYFYYRNPETGLWSIHSWDLDLTWADNMFDSGCGGKDDLYRPLFGEDGRYPFKPALTVEYKNRVREIRDLLFNSDQAGQLIDEYAGLLRGPTNTPTFLDADRCQWDYNPKMISSVYSDGVSKAGQGRFYQWPHEPTVSKDFNGCIQLMKNYVAARGQLLDGLALSSVPATPVVTNLSPPGYPLNRLQFRCSAYSGAQPFAAMKWRVGEVAGADAPPFDPTQPRPYEIDSVWESEAFAPFASDVTLPANALKVGRTYRVRARLQDVTGRWSHWSAPVQFVAGEPDLATALTENLRISEVMYDPLGGGAFEFVELYNRHPSQTLDLGGAKFTKGIDLTFPAGTLLPPGGYLVVIKTTEADFRHHYGLAPDVLLVGPFSGSLANEGEELKLKTAAGGTTVISFTYGNDRGWPLAAAKAGHSLVPLDRALEGQATGALDYPGNWRASTFIGGSPGRADPTPPPQTVVLNEIVAHTDYSDPAHPEYDSNDWIELYNGGETSVSLADWYLSDNPAKLRKWAIPAVTLPPDGRISFDEVTGFHNPITTGFGLDKAGEQVLLSYLPGTDEDRVVDAIRFKGQENEVSLGRYPDAGEDWFTLPRTRDATNAPPLAHAVISEIHYHPPAPEPDNTPQSEFIELFNPTLAAVPFANSDGAWRLDGGIHYTFPSGHSLPAGGLALVVPFDPADSEALAIFRDQYAVTNPAVPIFGPYTGKLSHRSDRVALEQPQRPDLPGQPSAWVIVDEVIYGNQTPWSAEANGGGLSLQRVFWAGNGNNPSSWYATAPTAGFIPVVDRDGDGMPDDWELAHQLDPEDPADAALDADGDGCSNLDEFLAGTDPRDPTSVFKFTHVSAAPEGIHLQFSTVANRSYSVQVRSNVSGTWQKLQDIPPSSTNGVANVYDFTTTNAVQRLYRAVTPALP